MNRFPAVICRALLASLITACSKQTPNSLPLPLGRYPGCYAIRGVGTQTGQSTWRTLRLTTRRYKDSATTYVAAFFRDNDNYLWYLRGDTVQVRPRPDRGMVNGWVDSLALWPRGTEFVGYLHEVADVLPSETNWEITAGRIRCEL